MKVEGEHTKDKDGKIVCKCGEKYRFKVMSHVDGIDFAITTYQCECGNIISVTEKVERWW